MKAVAGLKMAVIAGLLFWVLVGLSEAVAGLEFAVIAGLLVWVLVGLGSILSSTSPPPRLDSS